MNITHRGKETPTNKNIHFSPTDRKESLLQIDSLSDEKSISFSQFTKRRR